MTNLGTRALARLAPCLAAALLLGGSAVVAQTSPSLDADAFELVVNAKNPVRELDRRELSDLFLKRVTRWPDGTPVEPVDQVAESRARRRFDEQVLGRSAAAVRNSWEQQIFSGRDVPPPELPTDEAVVAYVAHHSGAIGYVTPGTTLPPTVRGVTVP